MACELLLRDPLKMAGAWFERLWIHRIELPAVPKRRTVSGQFHHPTFVLP
jgi:hypothetical protein